ncbi:hypothetical protein FGIG_03924 [Fasciola gigantica]|uniref:Uncharacterized protein n=1 Tax=Fasciola gigantica TaxID=46835 RepID=A0A504YTV4_FASGI|nr:hypothetical protein FGIG_03924 [Fasciola gigantica]
MSETNQKSAGYKRSKFIASRIFGKFSNPSKQSPVQSNRSCHSFDEPPKQFSPANSSFAGWDKDEGGGLAEDELIFIFPDRSLTPFCPSDAEDGKRKSNSEDFCCHPVSNPFSTRPNAHPSPVDRRARLRPVNQRIPKNEITRTLLMDQEITLQMRLMRTQNVWCIPDVSRGDSELLLANTDPGVSALFG